MHLARLLGVSLAATALGCTTADPGRTDTGTDAAPVTTPRDVDTASPAAAGGCSASALTGDGVGPVRIGASVDAVRSACGIVAEGTRPGPEGSTTRYITVAMGRDTVDAEIVDGRVWRVPVTSPGLRTSDGIGVGTPLREVLALRDVRPAMGEGLYVLSPAHCGMSFQLDDPEGPLPPASTLEELRRLPARTVVSRVLLTGCG